MAVRRNALNAPAAKYTRLMGKLAVLENSLILQVTAMKQERSAVETKISDFLQATDRIAEIYSNGASLLHRIGKLDERCNQIDVRIFKLNEKLIKTRLTNKKISLYAALGESQIERKRLEEVLASHVAHKMHSLPPVFNYAKVVM
jgi:hypothetical protein